MEQLIEAIKSNDLVKAKKAFGAIMTERTLNLVESRKLDIAKSVLIEGEESEEDDEDSEKDNAKEKSGLDKSEKDKSKEQENDEEDDEEDE